jgi:small conductance mechanosensitive channel
MIPAFVQNFIDMAMREQWLELAVNAASVGVKILATLIVAKIILRFGYLIVDKFLKAEKEGKIKFDERKIKTIAVLLKSMLKYVIYFIAGVTVLRIFGIPTESIIATAGIGGLAIGFGAQNLVRDVITGFFILFEDQFSVGDYIETAGLTGFVEEMGLRVTKLRSFSGELHIIPNGEINKVTNHSRGSIRALVDVDIAYEEDIDRALKTLNEVCQQMAQEREDIVEGPTVLGVQELGSSSVVIRIIAKTVPLQQWSVERELRKRIKETFDERGIEIPYPRRVIIQQKPKS